MKKAVLIPFFFTILMWLSYIIQHILQINLINLGIYPRDTASLFGIFTSPFIHGNIQHLLSNTLPLLILGTLLFLMYKKVAIRIWVLNYIFTGLLVWLFARDSYHIGASGIIYGLASFLFFSGFFRMDIKSIAIASGLGIFYGSLVWGILPLEPGISWESHLFGGIVGLTLAYLYRNTHKDKIAEEYEKEINARKTFEEFLKK